MVRTVDRRAVLIGRIDRRSPIGSTRINERANADFVSRIGYDGDWFLTR